jgi:hypothetical protein
MPTLKVTKASKKQFLDFFLIKKTASTLSTEKKTIKANNKVITAEKSQIK